MDLTKPRCAKVPKAGKLVRVICPKCKGTGLDPDKVLNLVKGKGMKLVPTRCLQCSGERTIMAPLALPN